MHLKKVATTFLRIILFPMIVVGVISACAWLVDYIVPYFLSNERTFGSTTITPYGYHQESLLDHYWDSVKVDNGTSTIVMRNVAINATLLNKDSRGLSLATGSMTANITLPPEDSTKTKEPLESLVFPEKAKFYIPVQLQVGKGEINLSNGNSWSFENFFLKSEGKKKANLAVNNVQGTQIPKPAGTNINVDFSTSNVKVHGKLYSSQDTLDILVMAPKDNMLDIASSVDTDVENLDQWLPFEWPQKAPQISGINVKANVKTNIGTGEISYQGTAKAHMSEIYPLMALDAAIEFDGNDKDIHVNAKFRNREGGSMELDADIWKNGNINLYGNVKNMNAKFGPQTMPLDLTIHSAELRGKKLHAIVETRQGSNIDANLDFENGFSLTYVGDISPYEPWAIDWSKGNLVLGKTTKVYGSFKDAHMHALVKFDTIPYAYNITADSMVTTLDLYRDRITFSDGIIYSPKETFDFEGEVVWNPKNPHTSWRISQHHGGVAEAYIYIIDSTAIQSKADNVAFETIPFANFKFNENLSGNVTGYFNKNFDTHVASLEATVDGEYQPFKLQMSAKAKQNGDSIFIDKFEAIHNHNKVEAEASFIIPNDSNPDFKPTGTFPIQIIHAWASAHEFGIPLLLEPLNDTTFSSGLITGDIAYNEGQGLVGNIDFRDLEFSNIPKQLFCIHKMNLFAEASKIELSAYLGIGGGGWTGNTQVIVDNVFEPERHVSISHNSDNGGNLWAEGFIDTSFVFTGKLNANGSWFIPGSISEIKRTDLQIQAKANLREGIKGITADIRLDSTLYQPPKFNYKFPIKLRGHMENGLLDVTEVETRNDSGEIVTGNFQFDMDSLRLKAFNFHSDRYTFQTSRHQIIADNINGSLESYDDSVTIMATIPSIEYKFHDETLGDANALGSSKFSLHIPHNKDGIIQNKTLSGELLVDKLVYTKELDIEITPNSIDKFITMFNNAIIKLRKKEVQETKISTASPINLAVHVTETQKDSVEIITPFAEFPFTFDIWVLGTTNRPLLRGDIGNSNTGFIGVKDLYQFDLNSFSISWNNVPWQHGVVDVSSQQELPYCSASNETEEEDTCPVNLNIQGTITNPQPTPSSNCGNENSAAAIYYNIFLGCIADNNGETTDWNKIAGKAIGKVLSTTANRTLGGDYIGDIDMKVMLFESNTTSDRDSSYFKIPVSLDRWVKDLSLIFGYTQDQSNENRTYDQALQFGANYTLPFFKEKDYSHKNHLSPSLSLNAMLISKQYITNTGTEGYENRIEKNIGFNYVYRYWNPCLLYLGSCETIEPDKLEDTKK